MKSVKIFDTTLRDGEQAPGFSMNGDEKLSMAHQLARLGVDCIEAGFAASSSEDYASICQIALEVGGQREAPAIAALARCHEKDIERAAESLKSALRPRIHVFIATSSIHMEHKLSTSAREVLDRASHAVRMAREFCEDVEFSAEDAFRSDPKFLAEITHAVVEAGASMVNIPDTVGYAFPGEVRELFRFLKLEVPTARFSFHGHNDLGLAVANSLAAIEAGADQIECTINGIGERAGNAALEEIVMALDTRRDLLCVDHGVDTSQLFASSRLLGHITGIGVQPNKAIVGANAFAHEAGIHQHGVLANPETYEIMRPESIGLDRNDIVLGKHSGRHALKVRLSALGIDLDGEDLEAFFSKFKSLAAKKKRVYDDDLLVMMTDSAKESPGSERYSLAYIKVTSGTGLVPSATVAVREGEREYCETVEGEGPIDAVLKAVQVALGQSFDLLEYRTRAVSPGKDAIGEVMLRCKIADRTVVGRGRSTDTLEAGALAAIDALNRNQSICNFVVDERNS